MEFRSAYWAGKQGEEILLTAPEHSELSDEDLLAEAKAEAERAGLDLSYGRLVIGTWTDSRLA